jgi:hypothetical protein
VSSSPPSSSSEEDLHTNVPVTKDLASQKPAEHATAHVGTVTSARESSGDCDLNR